MKELSIEQKAKVYDEVVKRAKEKYAIFEGTTAGDVLEDVFSELKESKDEWIRKWLMKMVEEVRKANPTNADHNGNCSEAIAWLEKQGEKDKLINELGKYKAKYIQEVLEKHINSMNNKDDERLRKTTIDFLKEYADKGYENAVECIDWLEKQGTPATLSEEEQNRFAKGVLTSCTLSFINYLDGHKYEGKMCVSNGECEDIENAFHNAMWDKLHRYYDKYIEKQGEKNSQGKSALEAAKEEKVDNQNCVKPTDKGEPKFEIEEGKWYVCIKDLLDNYANKAFYKGDIYLSTQDGSLIPCNNNVPFEVVCPDTYFREWTIQDARDGDVLAIDWHKGDNYWEQIVIFKKYHNKGIKGLYNMPCVEGYGNTFKNGNLVFNEEVPYYFTTWTSNLYPATKEQRDLLFKKMKEAGYKWDAEKKELKKIKI